MSERIDHVAEAHGLLRVASTVYRDKESYERATLIIGMAQAEATLALVEQARIANLIALGGPTHPKLCEQVSSDAATALTEWHPHENAEMGGWYELSPDVAAALGIDTEGESDGGE